MFCNLIIFSDYIFVDQQGVKHGGILQSVMSKLRKKHHFSVDVKKKDFVFAKCIVCESLKDLISKLRRNISDVKEYELNLKKPLTLRVVQKLVPYLEVQV